MRQRRKTHAQHKCGQGGTLCGVVTDRKSIRWGEETCKLCKHHAKRGGPPGHRCVTVRIKESSEAMLDIHADTMRRLAES